MPDKCEDSQGCWCQLLVCVEEAKGSIPTGTGASGELCAVRLAGRGVMWHDYHCRFIFPGSQTSSSTLRTGF